MHIYILVKYKQLFLMKLKKNNAEFSFVYIVIWPIWITIGKWMLMSDDLTDEIDMKFGFDYSVRPLFISVSLFIGIFIQSILPRTKSHATQTLKTLSNYYLLFYFAISLFCMAGSTTLRVSHCDVVVTVHKLKRLTNFHF